MTQTEQSAIEGRGLLLYDGVCALCNGVVQFLLNRDGRGVLRFAPLQSSLGRETLGRFHPQSVPDGVVLVADALTARERIYYRSDAVAAALEMLPSPWRLVGRVLRLVPRSLREFGYGVVARIRYRLFGRYDVCPLPPPGMRDRLLGANNDCC